MQPKTKFEKRVAELVSSLRPVSAKQIAWGYDSCFEKQAVTTKSKAYCLDCGACWKHSGSLHDTKKPFYCPDCGKKLKRLDSKKRTSIGSAYFGITTTFQGIQLIRILTLQKDCKAGRAAQFITSEVIQHWIQPDGQYCVRERGTMSMYGIVDSFCGEMAIRSTKSYTTSWRAGIRPFKIYPDRRLIPELSRNGFDGNLHGFSEAQIFRAILRDSEAETLLKAGQLPLLRLVVASGTRNTLARRGVWDAVKICLRRGYMIEDASSWVDYIELLQYFKKDTRNPHYVCPADFQEQHRKLWSKKLKIDRQRWEAERRAEEAKRLLALEDYQRAYEMEKGKFFGLCFVDGNLSVEVMKSLEQFQAEGQLLNHCVFANGYYKRSDSLIMSARIDGTPVETVEISLRTLQILQARGRYNQPSPHNHAIVDLVKRNLPAIGKLLTA